MRRCSRLLFVWYTIYMSVCSNSFVMYVVSLLEYVNVARVYFARGLFGSWVRRRGVYPGRNREGVVCRMLWIKVSSCWYSAVCSC